jgi:hypothetical protein
MKTLLKFGVLAAALSFLAVAILPTADGQTKGPTAARQFKSIKVLNDMPADQMGKVMNIMSASLGVNCVFCHASNDGDYEKEGNEHKDMARQMLKMTFDLNKNYFGGRVEINCNSCHQGKSHPQPNTPLKPVATEERPPQPAKKPTTAEILARYETALGGKANLSKITSRVIKAQRLEPDGKTREPEEIWQKGVKMAAQTTYGSYVIAEGWDGAKAWKRGNNQAIELKPDEAANIQREAELFANPNLAAVYAKLEFRLVDKIEGREVYLVIATTAANQRERLYFDAQTGLLTRRSVGVQTILGPFVYQVDYADYKDFGGVKLPATTRFAVPQIRWTRQILEVKNNAAPDDSKFSQR